MSGLIGKKIGMTSVFNEEGKNIPCTVIEAGPCVVTQVKTVEKDGYSAVQIAYDDKAEKNTKMKLPILLTLCLLAGVVNPARPQARRTRTQTEQTRSADRERAKREQAVADSLAHLKALRSLDRLDFALEADRLTLRRGRVVFVSSDTNFVTLSGDMATVQVAPFMGGGPNGIGGITLEGHASNIRVRTDKRGNTTFSMNVFGRGISATLSIRLPAGSNRASVSIDPNFSSDRIQLTGVLVPLDESRVFKGSAL